LENEEAPVGNSESISCSSRRSVAESCDLFTVGPMFESKL
jgi:hypothetical protein